MSRGIDYGMGQTNIDPETGIRYGIISANRLCYDFWESMESVYSHNCPSCGNDLDESFSSPDYCPHCEQLIGDGEDYSEEPVGHMFVDDEYELLVDSSNDVWVFKSPYVAKLGFCSPCAPGACHMESPREYGALAYVLGPEWFESPAEDMPYKPVRR